MRTPLSAHALVVMSLAFSACLIGACSAEQPNPRGTGQAVQAPRCNPGDVHMCACPGSAGSTQTLGMQICNAMGTYDVCTGCPAIAAQPMAGATAGMTPGITGGAAGVAGASGVTGGGGAAAAGASGSISMEDSGTPDVIVDASEPTPAGAVEPGTSCGVGLVSLCELGTEKCCTRSLETDTCIAASEACSCGLANCTVMEAHCDGPEDCADGEFCCGTLSQSGAGYDDFTCAAQCDVNGQQRAACHQQEPECPSGLTCANSQLLTNVQVCIDPATIQQ